MAMHRLGKLFAVFALGASLAGCDSILGEDKTPRSISWSVQGEAGFPVQVILSKQFVAGVTELGVTEVAVFGSDTLDTVLPVEGDMDVSLERRFFIQVTPLDTLRTLNGRLVVNVDGRGIFNEQGTILWNPPLRFVYVFNQPTTRIIEVI